MNDYRSGSHSKGSIGYCELQSRHNKVPLNWILYTEGKFICIFYLVGLEFIRICVLLWSYCMHYPTMWLSIERLLPSFIYSLRIYVLRCVLTYVRTLTYWLTYYFLPSSLSSYLPSILPSLQQTFVSLVEKMHIHVFAYATYIHN